MADRMTWQEIKEKLDLSKDMQRPIVILKKYKRHKKAWLLIPLAMMLAAGLVGCGTEQKAQVGQAEQTEQTDQINTKETESINEEKTEQDESRSVRTYVMEKEEISEEKQEDGAETDTKEHEPVTFSILGDSISTYAGAIPEGYVVYYPENGAVQKQKDTWWQMFADETESVLYANSSSAGSACVGDSMSMESPRCACNELRISDLGGPEGKMPDVILVYMGTNDLLMSIPIGTNDGTGQVTEGEVTTFSDAYTLMLDKLEREYPISRIYCCTLTQVADWGKNGTLERFVNGVDEGLTAADYNARIEQIAESRGLQVIDLYHCGIHEDNWNEMTTDGVHPTPDGMRCIADAVIEALQF